MLSNTNFDLVIVGGSMIGLSLVNPILEKGISKSIGILYKKFANKFEDDFICKNGYQSTDSMNAISPAFTSSFSLADLLLSTQS